MMLTSAIIFLKKLRFMKYRNNYDIDYDLRNMDKYSSILIA